MKIYITTMAGRPSIELCESFISETSRQCKDNQKFIVLSVAERERKEDEEHKCLLNSHHHLNHSILKPNVLFVAKQSVIS